MKKLFSFLFLSAAFRSLQEIAKWRFQWSWIPADFFTYRGWHDIDPYHFVTTLHWLMMLFAGMQIIKIVVDYRRWLPNKIVSLLLEDDWRGFFLVGGLVWLIHGLLNNLFYHFIWMKPEYWFR